MASESELKAKWSANKLSSCKIADLKAYLKSVGLPMVGEVSAVAARVGMWMDVKYLDLFVLKENGQKSTPFELKQPELRKIVAQLGMDPTGDKDELYGLLIDYLKKKNANADKGSKGQSSKSGGTGNDDPIGVTMAKQIIEMENDYPAVLSASGINITVDSSVATMRKAYLKLSLLIHPDKLVGVFPDATRAFQCLVNAYERMSQPELYAAEEEDEKKDKTKKVMRSNDGCFRTQLHCPRCNTIWGLPDSGVEKYDYNFMMMGLRTYNCTGCLFEFGCMTAIHKCPHCRREFEYHPNDYHRKITCTNQKCKKPIGFFIFHISDRMEKEYRKEIRKKQEERLKKQEQLDERSKRAKAKHGNSGIGVQGKEKLFLLNLLDNCPRCGEDGQGDEEVSLRTYEERESHLASCNDKKKMAAYAKQLKNEEDEAAQKKAKKEAEAEVQNAASWDYLGAKTSDLWLLTEKQVKVMCENYKIDTEDGATKDELIAKLVSYRNSIDSKRMLTQGGEGEAASASSSGGGKRKKTLTPEDMPDNMEGMSVGQLKAVAASFGIILGAAKSKDGIIQQIQKQFLGQETYLMLEDKKEKKGGGKKSKSKK